MNYPPTFSLVRRVPTPAEQAWYAQQAAAHAASHQAEAPEGLMDWGGITDEDFALAFSDYGEYDGDEDSEGLAGMDDLGGKSKRLRRRRRRKSRRFQRAAKKGRTKRQVAIALRIAIKAAASAGKKVSRGKAMRAARRASKSTKSVRKAVMTGLKAGGLSSADARKFASIGLAIARKGGSKKAVEKALKRMARRRKQQLAKKKALAAEKGEKGQAQELQAEEDAIEEAEDYEASTPYPEEDFSDGEDGEEFDEDLDSENGDFSGFLAETYERSKPYLPWVLVGLGAVAVLTSKRK